MKNYQFKKKSNSKILNYNDIQFQKYKENKENFENLLNIQVEPKIFYMKKKLASNPTPMISKCKKIIMFREDKYDKTLQKGKSPFFISDKINFRNEFKILQLRDLSKPKHLGLCDYYKKKDQHNIKEVEEEIKCDNKTPRFHKEKY